jgi:hypothetical protein
LVKDIKSHQFHHWEGKEEIEGELWAKFSTSTTGTSTGKIELEQQGARLFFW